MGTDDLDTEPLPADEDDPFIAEYVEARKQRRAGLAVAGLVVIGLLVGGSALVFGIEGTLFATWAGGGFLLAAGLRAFRMAGRDALARGEDRFPYTLAKLGVFQAFAASIMAAWCCGPGIILLAYEALFGM